MRYEFQDLNGQRWQVALSSSDAGLEIDSLARGDENIVSHLSAKVGVQQVTLSDGSRAKLCKVGDDWWVHHQGRTHRVSLLEVGTDDSQISDGSLVAPMPGTILDIMVTPGELVSSGQPLLLMEAMKMEHKIVSPSDGMIENLLCNIGDRVDQGVVLIVVDATE